MESVIFVSGGAILDRKGMKWVSRRLTHFDAFLQIG